jgi:hypothetical protein
VTERQCLIAQVTRGIGAIPLTMSGFETMKSGSFEDGITNFAQEQLGEILYIELPKVGTHSPRTPADSSHYSPSD